MALNPSDGLEDLGVDRLMGGREAKLDLAQGVGQGVQLLGSTLRSRNDQFKADLFSDLSQHVCRCCRGRLKPQLVKGFPVKDAEAAFAELASNTWRGNWFGDDDALAEERQDQKTQPSAAPTLAKVNAL